tara:strand:+ start:421 stop:837 length:417 start_codon:yes stop_codon:yes gene_type:complete
MSYVQSTIGKDEKIIYYINYHWAYVALAYFYLIIFGVFIVGVILFFRMMINKWTTERVLTNKRYIQKTGWISRKTEEISVHKIEEVEFNQSILGRVLNYGSVLISGTGVGKIKLNLIDDPLIFQKKLNNVRFVNVERK